MPRTGEGQERPAPSMTRPWGDITVYLLAEFPGRDKLLPKLRKHKVGGGCLHSRQLSDVDLKVVELLIVSAVAERQRRHT
jgi:hypothetical protein